MNTTQLKQSIKSGAFDKASKGKRKTGESPVRSRHCNWEVQSNGVLYRH